MFELEKDRFWTKKTVFFNCYLKKGLKKELFFTSVYLVFLCIFKVNFVEIGMLEVGKLLHFFCVCSSILSHLNECCGRKKFIEQNYVCQEETLICSVKKKFQCFCFSWKNHSSNHGKPKLTEKHSPLQIILIELRILTVKNLSKSLNFPGERSWYIVTLEKERCKQLIKMCLAPKFQKKVSNGFQLSL